MSYRVLHVLDHSWPILSGYSVRSRDLVSAQMRLGHRPSVLTGPLHEIDDRSSEDTVLEGTEYLRTPFRGAVSRRLVSRRWPGASEAIVVALLRARISMLLGRERYDVVHAHSPALCGLAAWLASRSRRLPFVYEIRAFWEDAAVDQKKATERSIRYRLSRGLEGFVAKKAGAVVGIAGHIVNDLRARGIAEDKLFHVPNGVDSSRFSPRPRDEDLARRLGIRGEVVLGFFGTLYRYEGVSWLVSATSELRRKGVPFKLLIAGQGEDLPAIETAAREAAVGSSVVVLGQVPHDEIGRYYSVTDIAVYPRRRARITELVTPLKPLEAMVQGKAVLASSVGGIRELVEPNRTGVLFEPEDVEDFCRNAERLIGDERLRRELGERSRKAVLEEKDWRILARRYEAVYEAAIRRAAAAEAD